jgi:putative peptide zinc metalloprotease protein
VASLEVTSAWKFRSKWHRIYTSAAGMYAELLVAAVAALAWRFVGDPALAQRCHSVVLLAGVSTLLFNANVLMRFDGYYVLADLLEIQNLYASGRQYVHSRIAGGLLNVPAPVPAMRGWRAIFIKVYGVAATLWRIAFYAGVIVVAASLWHGAGLVLALLCAVLWLVLPAARLRRRWMQPGVPRPSPARLAVVTGMAATLALAACFLPWPVGVNVPAAVEYAPLTVLRNAAPGTVQEVHVQPGDLVRRGQLLVLLDNADLRQQQRELQLEQRKSRLNSRIWHGQGELAACLAEQARREDLEDKLARLRDRIRSLQVRATTGGRVVSASGQDRTGQYVASGTALIVLGTEESKELLASVDQRQLEHFTRYLGHPARIRVRGTGAVRTGTRLTQIGPHASRQLPHAALGAHHGGPLTVRPVAAKNAMPGAPGEFELTQPRFTATLRLSADLATRLRAGQLARVHVGPSGKTIFHAVSETLRGYVEAKTVAASR